MCLYISTLPLSDSYEFSFLSFVIGVLALIAVFRFGGLRTVMGVMVTVFVARYYFVPLLMKTVEGRPIWHNLYSPTETLLVFTCSLLAMLVVSVFFRERASLSTQVRTLSLSDSNYLRRLTIVTFLIGAAATLLRVATQQVGQSAQDSAMFLGGAGPLFAAFLPFSLSLSIYGAFMRNTSVLRSRSVILLLTVNVLFTLITVSRASVLILFVAIAVPYLFAGRRMAPSVIISLLVGFLLFALVVSPTIVYLRDRVEFYSLDQRIENIGSFYIESISDPEAITRFKTKVGEDGYFVRYFENYYGGMERFAILPDADRLINGTTVADQYGGWRTIVWAVRMVPPRLVYPDKPTMGPGAYLGQIAGFTNVENKTTQWVVGFPAEFYHAFSYVGVFLGVIAVLGLFFLVIKVFDLFGVHPVWKMLLAIYYWNFFSEGNFAAILYSSIPLCIFAVIVHCTVRSVRRWRFVL
jgi:hypothetical protein